MRPRFINRIDWKKLKEQKATLIEVITDIRSDAKIHEDNGYHELSQDDLDDADKLDGLVHLIDAIQDYAVDSMGMSEEEIFNLTDE